MTKPRKNPDTLDDLARAEAVTGGAAAILRALGETLQLHGPDPLSEPIIAAAMVHAISLMEKKLGLTSLRVIVHKMTDEKEP